MEKRSILILVLLTNFNFAYYVRELNFDIKYDLLPASEVRKY